MAEPEEAHSFDGPSLIEEFQAKFADYDLAKMKRSVRTHNQYKASQYNTMVNIYNVAIKNPSLEAVTEMKQQLGYFKRSCAACTAGYEHIAELDPGDETNKKLLGHIADQGVQEADAEKMALKLFSLVKTTFAPTAQPQAPAAPRDDSCRPNTVLQPKELAADASPVEFNIWAAKYKSYYSTSKMQCASVEEQQHYLFACVSNELYTRVKPKVKVGQSPIFHDAGGEHTCIMALLTQEFKDLYPLTQRRYDWLNCKFSGSWSAYYAKMKELSDAAELSAMDSNQFLALSMVIGLPAGEMKNEMLRLEEPTLTDLDAIGRKYDRGDNISAALTPGPQAKAFAARQQQQQQPNHKGKPKGTPRAPPEWEKRRPDLIGKCLRCGGTCQPQKCPHKNEVCALCKKKGHLAKVCLSAGATVKAVEQQASPQYNYPPPPHNVAMLQFEGADNAKVNMVRAKGKSQPTPPLGL